MKKVEHRNPWEFIPSLSFIQAIPVAVIMSVLPLMYKSLGMENRTIGLTSLLMLPLGLKFILAPLVDYIGTKRQWISITQLVQVGAFLVLCLFLRMPASFMAASFFLFAVLAVCGGFCELPIDGFYLDALTEPEQAFFVGVKTAFIRIGVIFLTGVLVMATGKYGEIRNDVFAGWMLFFGVLTVILFGAWAWHGFILPHPKAEQEKTSRPSVLKSYHEPFKAFLAQPRAAVIIFFAVMFRAGEVLLGRMQAPFLLDSVEVGGMAVPVSTYGFYSTFTMITMILGGVLGGFALAKCCLRKTMIILSLCMTLPNLIYVFLAHYQPMQETILDLSFIPGMFGSEAAWVWKLNLYVQIGIAAETFGYGLGYSAFVYYICHISNRSKHKASFYAIATALQTLGWTLSGVVSGYLQEHIGYEWLFINSMIWSIPGILCVVYLSKTMVQEKANSPKSEAKTLT